MAAEIIAVLQDADALEAVDPKVVARWLEAPPSADTAAPEVDRAVAPTTSSV